MEGIICVNQSEKGDYAITESNERCQKEVVEGGKRCSVKLRSIAKRVVNVRCG